MNICGKEMLFALVILLGPLEFGFITVYPSPTKGQICAAHNWDPHSPPTEWTIYNSIVFLFAAFGPFVDKYLLNKYGGQRRVVFFVFDVIGAVFWFLNCLTKVNIYAGIVCRAALGLATGMVSGVSSMYLVEMAPAGSTGFFGSLNQIGIVVGQALWSFLGSHVSYMNFNYFGGVVFIVQAVLIWFIPESPAASAQKDGEDKPLSAAFRAEYAPGLIVGVVLMFIQQMSGINAILTDLSSIMNESGLALDPNYQSGITITAQFISVFASSLMVDKLGCKMVWILSSAVCALGLIMMALYQKYKGKWNPVFPLVSIFIYILGFGLGIGPVPWFIIPEYFTSDIRPACNSLVVLSNWVFSFIMVFAMPAMQKGIGDFGVFLFFGGVCIFSIFFGIFKITNPTHSVDVDMSPEQDESSDPNPSAL